MLTPNHLSSTGWRVVPIRPAMSPNPTSQVGGSSAMARKPRMMPTISSKARSCPVPRSAPEPASPTIAQTYTSILPRRLIDGRGYVDRGSPGLAFVGHRWALSDELLTDIHAGD